MTDWPQVRAGTGGGPETDEGGPVATDPGGGPLADPGPAAATDAGAGPGTGDEAVGVRPRTDRRVTPPPAVHRPQPWKLAFFGLAAAAIVAGVAWALLGSRILIVRSVRVVGTNGLVTQAQVLAAAGIAPGLPMIRVDATTVARRVDSIRQVLSATVVRDWPDTVVISVRLRTPTFAVAAAGGYDLIDPFGVDVRQAVAVPPGMPVLTGPAGSLRGNPAVHAAAVVLTELPATVGRQVTAVTATSASDVSVRLSDGVVIVWGDTSRPAEKDRELAVLMRTHARLYDVSAPGTAVTRG